MKLTVKNVVGESVEVIAIKGSGWDLQYRTTRLVYLCLFFPPAPLLLSPFFLLLVISNLFSCSPLLSSSSSLPLAPLQVSPL